jgi:hypothetical protein
MAVSVNWAADRQSFMFRTSIVPEADVVVVNRVPVPDKSTAVCEDDHVCLAKKGNLPEQRELDIRFLTGEEI